MNKKTNSVVLAGLLTAIVTIGTIVFRLPVPAPQGYVNLGDTFIFITAITLGRKYGLVAGGLGSALADLILGYANYSPWTLVIKGIEGFVVGALGDSKGLLSGTHRAVVDILSSALGGAWMVLGYYIAERIMFDWSTAWVSVPGNLIQAFGSLIFALVLLPVMRRALKNVHLD